LKAQAAKQFAQIRDDKRRQDIIYQHNQTEIENIRIEKAS
jgi:hypothetical protein